MTYENINTLMNELATALKCEYAYQAFKQGKRTRFLIFYYDGSDDFYADDINYKGIEELVIEFYSPNKEITTEKTIQSILTSHGLTYTKNSVYIGSEKMNMTTYNTEVIINEQSELWTEERPLCSA